LPGNIKGTEPDQIWFGEFNSLKEARDSFEKHYIERMLRRHQNNVTKTAEALQLERSNLHRKIKQYEIQTGT